MSQIKIESLSTLFDQARGTIKTASAGMTKQASRQRPYSGVCLLVDIDKASYYLCRLNIVRHDGDWFLKFAPVYATSSSRISEPRNVQAIGYGYYDHRIAKMTGIKLPTTVVEKDVPNLPKVADWFANQKTEKPVTLYRSVEKTDGTEEDTGNLTYIVGTEGKEKYIAMVSFSISRFGTKEKRYMASMETFVTGIQSMKQYRSADHAKRDFDKVCADSGIFARADRSVNIIGAVELE